MHVRQPAQARTNPQLDRSSNGIDPWFGTDRRVNSCRFTSTEGPVPAGLFRQQVRVARRRGIDLNPVDVGSDDDVRLLRVFTAAHRRARLLRAVDVAQDDPPEIIRADDLRILPGLLAGRSDEATTVVFQTLSTVYLTDSQRAQLRQVVEEAGADGPLAYIGTPTPEEHGERRGDYPIELALWPSGGRSIVARMENRGEWLEWIGRG